MESFDFGEQIKEFVCHFGAGMVQFSRHPFSFFEFVSLFALCVLSEIIY